MSSEITPCLRYEKQASVGTLWIDHPTRMNAMTFDMWESMPGLLDRADQDDEVRALVLRGAGDQAFSSGSDISQFGERRSTEEGVALWNGAVQAGVARLARVSKPVIALISGYCFGGGVGMALHCDLRYIVNDGKFSIPAAKLGVAYYPSWLKRLSALVGPAVAKEIMFTARRYDAQQALSVGLVNGVISADEAETVVRNISSLAPLTHYASKLAIDEAVMPGAYGLEACDAAVTACFRSSDYKEGQAAFKEKRPPAFRRR